MQPFTEKALQVIQNVPAGKVMTYGQVARCAGSPRGARQIARLLHSMSEKHGLPWHRIVNSQGKLVLADEEARHLQRTLLEQEGVEINRSGLIDLEMYRHNPDDSMV
ncbi:methylated-DNA-protein-cysteine methyltransferase-like protein [Planomicrobium soli]|uniref:Methylated-DNA-protein-cysteine methyltransferase-like protein n=1 Tax=Planomicrobium soli TaxID=1176648 RepID=A0A2P8GCF7_9BACL|nr:MGMT family protein [Planomicrobium soli]PSL31636.1 methylated-DNA-protein-cysteine methyltransferase-like protein [Planomicrobium soli]